MKSADLVRQAFDLRAQGQTHAVIAAELGVSIKTVGQWLSLGPAAISPRRVLKSSDDCPDGCVLRGSASAEYAYLLGQYLGDGWIGSNWPRECTACTSSVALPIRESWRSARTRSSR